MKIAIASGKGGTGKTSLATNLAAMLAEHEPTVLADLDVEEPNSSIFIKHTGSAEKQMFKQIPRWDAERCTLCNKCQEVCNFNAVIRILDEIIISEELCHGCYACSVLCPDHALEMINKEMGRMHLSHSGKLHFIESRLNIGEEQAVPLIGQTLDYIDENFSSERTIIIDAPPGTSCPIIEIASAADLVILVTEPTRFGLHDLKLSVETMRKLQRPHVVVINRDGIGDDQVGKYCHEQGIKVIARIPYSRKIAERYAEGLLTYKELPEVYVAVEQVKSYILSQKVMH
jgi:MinD superfamily P-loop ATPase